MPESCFNSFGDTSNFWTSSKVAGNKAAIYWLFSSYFNYVQIMDVKFKFMREDSWLYSVRYIKSS